MAGKPIPGAGKGNGKKMVASRETIQKKQPKQPGRVYGPQPGGPGSVPKPGDMKKRGPVGVTRPRPGQGGPKPKPVKKPR